MFINGSCHAQDLAESDVSRIMKKAREDAKKINLPVNTHQEAGLKAAKETANLFHSSKFQEQVQCEQQRLEKEVFKEYTAPWKKKTRQAAVKQKNQTGNLVGGEQIFLFISSSVPDETVHAYIASIDKAGDQSISLVMRGLVGGLAQARVKKGQSYFSRIMKKELDCPKTKTPCDRYKVLIRLKPSLFTKYGITRAPAVVYEHDGNTFLIQGDTGLDYLLERINREAKSTGLTSLVKKIRGTL
jgi:hypothetical protein